MNSSTLHLLDLPDEILIEIFNKLPRVDVLYSISGVNKRLDRLACDPVFTHFLDLTTKTSFGEQCSMPDIMLNRFCSFILPKIQGNIQSFLVEPSSIERILVTCDYPKLHKLIFNSINPEVFIEYLSDDSPIVHIFKQITHLEMSTLEYYNTRSRMELTTIAYARLFAVCQRLTHLNVNGKHLRSNSWAPDYALPLTTCSSSMIVELNVKVRTIDDCLRILDGRFNQMKTFIVKIDSIGTPSLSIDNQINLTEFFLASCMPTEEYDNAIVPLLRRMPNMEKLSLILNVENRSKFIDAADLYHDILIYMPRISELAFNITTMNDYVDLNYWFKNDDIQERRINDDGHPFIHCCIDYFTNGVGRCRIASYSFI